MLEKINQQQFEQLLEILINYKKINPKEDVYLNEVCIKRAFNFMNSASKQLKSQVNLNLESASE